MFGIHISVNEMEKTHPTTCTKANSDLWFNLQFPVHTLFSETISCRGRDCKEKLDLMEIRLKGFISLFNTLKTPICVCLFCLISARHCTSLSPCNQVSFLYMYKVQHETNHVYSNEIRFSSSYDIKLFAMYFSIQHGSLKMVSVIGTGVPLMYGWVGWGWFLLFTYRCAFRKASWNI